MSQVVEIQDAIQTEWSHLLGAWQEAQVAWKDEVAAQFAKRFLSQWEAEMPSFLSALESLDQELQDAQRELQ